MSNSHKRPASPTSLDADDEPASKRPAPTTKHYYHIKHDLCSIRMHQGEWSLYMTPHQLWDMGSDFLCTTLEQDPERRTIDLTDAKHFVSWEEMKTTFDFLVPYHGAKENKKPFGITPGTPTFNGTHFLRAMSSFNFLGCSERLKYWLDQASDFPGCFTLVEHLTLCRHYHHKGLLKHATQRLTTETLTDEARTIAVHTHELLPLMIDECKARSQQIAPAIDRGNKVRRIIEDFLDSSNTIADSDNECDEDECTRSCNRYNRCDAHPSPLREVEINASTDSDFDDDAFDVIKQIHEALDMPAIHIVSE